MPRLFFWISLILAFAAIELRAADPKDCEGEHFPYLLMVLLQR